MPRFRKESSRSRWERVSKLKAVVSKICASGLKVTLVPRLSVTPVFSSGVVRGPALVGLAVDLLVAPDLDLERLGERVHHRDAHAVQAARDLVGLLVELAARVELGEHHLGRVHARHVGCGPTGMPRPLSTTVTELSMWMVTLISLQ